MAESDIQNDERPAASVGARLRRAREAAGLSLADIAARTKIAERHLLSIEESRFAALASRTYAVGFARAFARTVGLPETEIAQAVRDELAAADSVNQPPPVDVFEPGDPARVPGSRLAWLAAAAGAIVLVLVFVFWRSFFSPAVSLPELTAEPLAVATTAAPDTAPSAAPAEANAPVVFTALEPDIWVKFYDAAGKQLMQKQMAQGESYTVPADAAGPQIRTGRPDALQVSVGGRTVPKLAEGPVNVKDIPVTAAALLARADPRRPTPAPSPAASVPATQASASPQASAGTPAAPMSDQSPAVSPAAAQVDGAGIQSRGAAETSTVSN